MLLAWSFDPFVVIGLLAMSLSYGIAVRQVSRAHPSNPWPRRRSLAFVGAMIAFAIALLSPVSVYSEQLLSVHMVQHLLLTIVGPALLAGSGPVTLALRAVAPRLRSRLLLPLLHSRIVGAISHPIVGWLALVAVMWGTHFSELYNLALLDPGVHAIEHVLYISAASLFWWPVFSPDPMRWRMKPGIRLLYVLTTVPHMSFLAISIMMAPRVLYPAYVGRAEELGIDALFDQQLAGNLLWAVGDFVLFAALFVVLREFMRQEDVETTRVDARLERQLRAREGK